MLQNVRLFFCDKAQKGAAPKTQNSLLKFSLLCPMVYAALAFLLNAQELDNRAKDALPKPADNTALMAYTAAGVAGLRLFNLCSAAVTEAVVIKILMSAEVFNYLALFFNMTADRAENAVTLTVLGAGGISAVFGNKRVSLWRNFGLLFNNVTARALFLIGKTFFGAGFLVALLGNYHIVTESVRFLLRFNHSVADRAVLALCLALFGAGGGNGGIDHFRVGKLFNGLRLNCLFAAFAVKALCTALCCACRSNCFNY